ncbi:hypothetical protein D7V80_12250 [Corallococcus sp. CA054B]|nr:hypothetical protein D7V80_12250 [Corallococcus sp. CA054B]
MILGQDVCGVGEARGLEVVAQRRDLTRECVADDAPGDRERRDGQALDLRKQLCVFGEPRRSGAMTWCSLASAPITFLHTNQVCGNP